MEQNEVTNFMYYMYNNWCPQEAENLFGKYLGEHIFAKYIEFGDGTLYFYGSLDEKCRQKLVDRANEIYG